MLFLRSCVGLPTPRLCGERVLTARCTTVHIYAYCNSVQIKPLECSLAVAELETATIILVNNAGLEQESDWCGCGCVHRQGQHCVGLGTSCIQSLCGWEPASAAWLQGQGIALACFISTVGPARGVCAHGVVLHHHVSSLKCETSRCHHFYFEKAVSPSEAMDAIRSTWLWESLSLACFALL